MKILVTGSADHLGEAPMRTLRNSGDEAVGMDILESDFTDRVGSILDREFVRHCIAGADAIVHTATLHKPHVASHIRARPYRPRRGAGGAGRVLSSSGRASVAKEDLQ